MTDCVHYAPMIGAREEELTGAERDALASHLSLCTACQARLADERALEGLLGKALLREASGRDFSAFVDGVMDRVSRSQHGRRNALGERARQPARLSWWRRHRLLAFGSALAPSLAVLGLVVYLHGQDPAPEAGDVEVVSQDSVPMVLETTDGPLVLLGDAEPQKS